MEYAYATCLLNESGEEINEKNLKAVLEAAGSEVQESRVKALVAALEDIEIDSAVDFEEPGSDPTATTGDPSEPTNSDLRDASGMDLVPAESAEGVDGSGETDGKVEPGPDGPEESPDDDPEGSADVLGDGGTEPASKSDESDPATDSDEV